MLKAQIEIHWGYSKIIIAEQGGSFMNRKVPTCISRGRIITATVCRRGWHQGVRSLTSELKMFTDLLRRVSWDKTSVAIFKMRLKIPYFVGVWLEKIITCLIINY